ncbi:MAG TPA: DUF5675 family protein [Saprospiraceae bacterium]|nr:DUF5675 family protein [Saprospiraceae bacterium]
MILLQIKRIYHPTATNGSLFLMGQELCKTIELPWKQNRKQISCIPEGVYPIRFRISNKFSRHIELLQVPNRSLILIHPANNAIKELRGCIAPVMELTAPGRGLRSKTALKLLLNTMDAINIPAPQEMQLEIMQLTNI